MFFCGRDHELNQLVERWTMASDVKNPIPQVVVIKAERGVGKTRLALEFNRWLSANNDQDGYWPAGSTILGRNIDVNPDPKDCNYRKPIPYLWWGLRGADTKMENGLAGAAVSNYDKFVAPHLVALGVRARMLSSGKAIIDTWLDVSKGELASWLGYDTVMSIGEGLVKTVAIVRGTYKERGESVARAAGEKHQQSRLDILMEELERIFNPRSFTYAKTPGVILIDDAQFAVDDTSLAKFSERLMNTAVSQGWPVMVLVTHWRRELVEDIKTENSFAGVLHHAREGITSDVGPVVGLPGGYLDGTNYLEIDLKPVPDLSGALSEALPGLTSDQRDKLLEHAGGNPRHLEQIISFLTENEDFFEDIDTSNALTAEGLTEALTETHDLFKVVLRRLRDAPQDVQEAICIASIQGISFVSDLVDDMMQSILKRGSLDALSKATNPYSMISKSQADEVAEFAERLFFQVADRRRKSLKSVADTNALTAALKSALRARLLDSTYRETADRQALAITYDLAAKIFNDGHEESILSLEALARLAALQASQNSYENALKTALHFQNKFMVSRVDIHLIDPVIVEKCAEILIADGKTAPARALLEPLLEYNRRAFSVLTTDASALSSVLESMADLEETDGNIMLGRNLLDEALKVETDAATHDTQNDRTLARLAAKKGWLEYSLGNQREAEIAHEESVVLRRKVAVTAPTPDAMRFLAVGIGQLEAVLAIENHYDEIVPLKAERLKICQELASNDPSDENLDALADAQLEFTGGALGFFTDHAAPEVMRSLGRQALIIRREHDARLMTPVTQRDLAYALETLASFEFHHDNILEGLSYQREGVSIRRQLAERLCTVGEKSWLSTSLNHLAFMEMDAGNTETAVRLLEECVGICREKAEILKTLLAYQSLLQSLDNLTECLSGTSKSDLSKAYRAEYDLIEASIAAEFNDI